MPLLDISKTDIVYETMSAIFAYFTAFWWSRFRTSKHTLPTSQSYTALMSALSLTTVKLTPIKHETNTDWTCLTVETSQLRRTSKKQIIQVAHCSRFDISVFFIKTDFSFQHLQQMTVDHLQWTIDNNNGFTLRLHCYSGPSPQLVYIQLLRPGRGREVLWWLCLPVCLRTYFRKYTRIFKTF